MNASGEREEAVPSCRIPREADQDLVKLCEATWRPVKRRISPFEKLVVPLISFLVFGIMSACCVGHAQTSSPIISLRLEPFVLRTGSDTCRLIVEADPRVVSIRVPNYFILYQGTLNTNIQLFDDGSHGDLIAGDHTFTSDQISFDLANDPFFAGQPLISTSYTIPSVTATFDDGRTETATVNQPLTVRLIRNESYVPPQIISLGSDAQRSSYCLNLIVSAAPTNNYDFDVASVTHRYYGIFPDDRDFLVIEDTFQRSASGVAGYHVWVSNRDHGFGGDVFDNSASFGSSRKLQAYIRTLSSFNAGLLNHELLHKWAAFLDALGLSSGSHWRAILRPSSGFGPNWGAYREFQFVSGRTYRAVLNSTGFVYSDLELYLMGLMGATNVAWPIQYLMNATPISSGYDPITQSSYQDFDADGIGQVSLAQVVAQYGQRTPAPPASQSRFKLGTIVVYDRLLSEVELAYYDMLAREYGRPSTTWSNFTAFESATAGRAEMITLLQTCFAGTRLEPLGNGQVLVSWPLLECGQALYHTTAFGDWGPLPPPYLTNSDHLSAVRSERAEFFQLRLPTQLLADYKLDGTSLDSTGNSPPMELQNTVFTNGSLYLNGIYESDSGFHAVARISGFSYESFTVALDFLALDFSEDNILTGGSSYRWFSLRHNAGRLELTLNNQALVYLLPDSRLMTNEWQSVVCSVDASAKRILIVLNGQRLGDLQLSPDFHFEVVGTASEISDKLFTFANNGNASTFHGYVRNLKVWNRALSSSEIGSPQ